MEILSEAEVEDLVLDGTHDHDSMQFLRPEGTNENQFLHLHAYRNLKDVTSTLANFVKVRSGLSTGFLLHCSLFAIPFLLPRYSYINHKNKHSQTKLLSQHISADIAQ